MLCARYQEWMIPAALDGLPPERTRELDAHLRSCAACRAEFERARMLSNAIDRGLAAAVNVQPSPQLVARVRSEISRMPAPSVWPFAHWIPLAACALAAVVLAALLLRPRVPSPSTPATPEIASAPVVTPASPARQTAAAPSHVRNSLARAKRDNDVAHQSKVLVPQGQWQAVARFAVAVGRGRVNGAEFIATAEKSRDPLDFAGLEIKPIVITPLSGGSDASADANKR